MRLTVDELSRVDQLIGKIGEIYPFILAMSTMGDVRSCHKWMEEDWLVKLKVFSFDLNNLLAKGGRHAEYKALITEEFQQRAWRDFLMGSFDVAKHFEVNMPFLSTLKAEWEKGATSFKVLPLSSAFTKLAIVTARPITVPPQRKPAGESTEAISASRASTADLMNLLRRKAEALKIGVQSFCEAEAVEDDAATVVSEPVRVGWSAFGAFAKVVTLSEKGSVSQAPRLDSSLEPSASLPGCNAGAGSSSGSR